MHVYKCGQLPEPEDTGGEADEEKVRGRMESCADDFRAGLVEIVSICDAPAGVGYPIDWVAMHQVGTDGVPVLRGFFAPDEYRTISADCVDLRISLSVIRSRKKGLLAVC